MNISTILGILVGLFTIVGGMILKGANVGALVNPAAVVIIFVGTFAALLNAFPMSDIKNMPSYFKLVFLKTHMLEKKDIATEIVSMSQIVRREGVLALESKEFSDGFMKMAVGMLVDGTNAGVMEHTLYGEIETMESRHKVGAQMFAQAGTYAPTLGVLGAVIGLIAALGNLNDIEKLGHAIAAAFVATLFGIFSGYVLWHPFANKLKQISKEEVENMSMIIDGVMSMQEGVAPAVIQVRMLAYIPEKKREALLQSWSTK